MAIPTPGVISPVTGCRATVDGELTDPPFYLPVFEEAYRFIIDEYQVSPKDIAIFIPCSVKKPYSSSPSHRLFHKVIGSILAPSQHHVVIFGTCGTVPAELELMYPFANYHYMLGKCTDARVIRDFLEIETYRIEGYLNKTRKTYKRRIAYCIGVFREAMERASQRTGTDMIILPTKPLIERMWADDCPFPEGSLSMKEYVEEFREGLRHVR
jgi:archaeosine synthase